MDLELVKLAAFLDELEKIAEVSIAGLSPATAMAASQPPPPMETAGYQKAKEILDRAEAIKTAAPYSPGTLPGLHTAAKSSSEKQPAHPSAVGQAKGMGAHVLGGMGAGAFLSNFAHGQHMPVTDAAKAAVHKRNWRVAAAGGALGAAEYGRQRLKRARLEKAKTSMISPAMQLKASKQVAQGGNTMRATSSIATQVRGSQI